MRSTPLSHPGLFSRIGVIGDIHTAVDRLEWALDVLRKEGVETLCATGDIVDGPYTGAAISRACELLRETRTLTVLGNHDRWLLDDERRDDEGSTLREDIDPATRAFLQELPATAELQTPRGLILLGHGLGHDDMGAFYPYDHGPSLTKNESLQKLLNQRRYRFVLGGHTHSRMVRKLSGVTFINAGAIQYTREPCCLLLDFINLRAQFFDHTRDGGTAQGPAFDL
jgi:predicted phosphodiesterase